MLASLPCSLIAPWLTGGCQPRTSILPVTAAEIRAERRSWRSSTVVVATAVNSSCCAWSFFRYARIDCCSLTGGKGRSRLIALLADIDAKLVLCLEFKKKYVLACSD